MIQNVVKKESLQKRKKFVYLKAYGDLLAIEQAIKTINKSTFDIQLTVLHKIVENGQSGLNSKEKQLEKYWNNVLGEYAGFGVLSSPEIGRFYIAGTLAGLFLHEIDGKPIGEMNTGIYGVLRGIGFHRNTVDLYLKDLLAGQYLLIARGLNAQISDIQHILG
ncbi:MAG: hypothetical protein CSA15_10285 [Candidatus Delongbacteria bacterium]|nr:MAG: hypothetical protein CSA15_10285 [Candidatus Delongbacteria bacterium]